MTEMNQGRKLQVASDMSCVCCTCGTTEQNPESGLCINDHDDWIEYLDIYNAFILGDKDAMTFVQSAEKKLGIDAEDIIERMKNGICL